MSFIANPFLANPAASIRKIEDNIRYILVSSWKRRQDAGLWWRRVMGTKTATSKRELVQWMLETARIHPLGNGGRMGFDDVSEWTHFIENESFGDGFRLTEAQLLEADGKAIDRAGQWARHMGNSGAYWPQEMAAYLLRRGKVLTCYDKKAFFAADHPVNPYEPGGVYFANLIKGYAFSPENLTTIYGYIEKIPDPTGKPRKVKPKIVGAGPDARLQVVTALGSETISDPFEPGTGSSVTNMIKTSYGFVEPILDADFSETGVWYLFCQLVEDDELQGLMYQEWSPYVLNSYASTSDAELSSRDEWQWHFKGWNGIGYGHPYLCFRIEADGTPTDLDAILAQFPTPDPTAD